MSLISLNITGDGQSIQIMHLYDSIKSQNYNLSILTILIPLDSQTYNVSSTVIDFAPSDQTGISSLEQVAFNTSVTLSQLYTGLSKVTDDLGKIYQKSADANLTKFADRYYTIVDALNSLSKTVEKQLPTYNLRILNSTAMIRDDSWQCLVCQIAFNAAIGIGCAIICACSAGEGCVLCWQIWNQRALWSLGVYYVCHNVINCDGTTATYYYVSSINSYSTYSTHDPYSASVNNPGNLVGSSPNGQYATLYAGNYGDQAMIIGNMNVGGEHGDISVYCYSGSGYYSNLYVYVSYDGNTWYEINSPITVSSTSPSWIDFGYTNTCFNYIAVVGYDTGNSVLLNIDAIRLTP